MRKAHHDQRREAVAPKRARRGAPASSRGAHALSAPPEPPPQSIERPQLLAQLHNAQRAAVVVVSAPAGYGKTTLLSQWASRLQRRAVAWVRLSLLDDRDPAALVGLLSGALERLLGVGEGAGDAAGALADADTLALADLLRLANSERHKEKPVLVLDGVDRVRSPEPLSLLAELACCLPQSLQLVLASRRDPPLALGRLRVERRLMQLDASDLAMGPSEARRLLARTRVRLDDEKLQELLARTEGWPAALGLATALLQPSTSANGSPEGSSHEHFGEQHAIARYIREEVIAPLDSGLRQLLTRASVLDQLSGDVCDAVLGRHDSGRALRELAAAGAMLTPQDAADTRFRCNPLVRAVLRAELAACEPQELPELHRRASRWFSKRGEIEFAVEHACAAGDHLLAGDLLWEHAAQFLYGRDEQLQRWLSLLTADQISSSPQLALLAAHGAVALADMPTATRWSQIAAEALERADATTRSPSLASAAMLVEAASGQHGIEQVARDTERLYASLGRADPMRALCALLHGVASHLLGEPQSAREHLCDAAAQARAAMPLVRVLSLTQLSLIDIEQRDWAQAQQRLDSACQCLREHSLDDRPLAALTHASSALVRSRRALADEAKRELTYASRLFASLGEFMPWFAVETRIVMARTSVRLADVVSARALLSQASHGARRPATLPRLLAWIDDAWGEIDELSAEALDSPSSLTMAELRVLRFLPTHLSFREIGERLHVSSNTVKSQAHAIYAKLHAASRAEAVANASALGLIDAAVV